MLEMSVSGQFLYFSLVSVFSGNAVTGASGAISGRRCTDGGSMTLLSGNIVEDAGGLYHVNLYDWDTSGRNIGYLITASGCALISFSVVTTGGVSGYIYPASGVNVTATATVNSGLFVTVPISSISGVNAVVPPSTLSGVTANSGLFTSVPIASISGVNAVVPVSSLSGIQPISGTFVSVPISSISGVNAVATATVQSGQVYLASGSFLFGSGQFYVASGSVTATVNSGLFVTVPVASISGVYPASGSMSGQPTSPQSGVVYLSSGTSFQATITSGQIWLASGQATSLNSGQSVLVYSGQLSGQPIAGLSGFIYPASGVNVTATATVNSGLFVTVPISSISGVNAVATATINSGQVWLASGQAVSLNSGQSVLVYSGQLSGQPTSASSGLFVTVPILSISGVNVVVPPSTLSGIQVASGISVSIPPASLLSGQTVLVASNQLAVDIPYGVWKVNTSGMSGEAIHSPLNAVRKLTNKWDTTTNSGFLTVFKEDALTQAYTQAITSQSGANPVVGLGDD